MSHFHEAQTEADLDPRHQGEPIADDLDATDEPNEAADTALTEYLGGRQPVLEPIDALLGGHDEP